MSTDAAASVSRWSWRRLAVVLLLVAAVGGGLAFYLDAPVAWHAWLAASDAYPDGKVIARADLVRANAEQLWAFAPSRLLHNINLRPDSWRAVICQSLTDRKRKADDQWSGALSGLAGVIKGDPNEVVRKTARAAYANLAVQPPVDQPALQSTLGDYAQGDSASAVALMEAVCKASPADRKAVLAWAQGYKSMPDNLSKRTAFHLLAREFADAPQSVDALLAVVEIDPLDDTTAKSLVQLADKNPGIWAQLLGGSNAAKAAAGLGLSEALKAASFRPPARGRGSKSIPAWAETGRRVASAPQFAAQVAKARTDLGASLASEIPAVRGGAIAFFAQVPGGGADIVKAAAAAKDAKVKLEYLTALSKLIGRGSNAESLKFDAEAGEALLALALEQDEAIYRAAGDIIIAGVRSKGPSPFFTPRSGPLDPKKTDVFRKMIDRKEGGYSYRDLIALSHFAMLDDLPAADVPIVAEAALRSAEGPLLQTIAAKLRSGHESHPKVQELLKTVPPSRQPPPSTPGPVVGRSARVIFWFLLRLDAVGVIIASEVAECRRDPRQRLIWRPHCCATVGGRNSFASPIVPTTRRRRP